MNVSKVIHQALFVYFLFSRQKQAETVKKNKHFSVKLPILLCVISIPLVKRLCKYRAFQIYGMQFCPPKVSQLTKITVVPECDYVAFFAYKVNFYHISETKIEMVVLHSANAPHIGHEP